MMAWVLLVVAIASNGGGSCISERCGNPTYRENPQVTMQEFSSKESCLFAQQQIQKKSGNLHQKLHMTCVPKGDVK